MNRRRRRFLTAFSGLPILLVIGACSDSPVTGPDPSLSSTSFTEAVPAPTGIVAQGSARIGGIDVAWETVTSTPRIDTYTVGYSPDPITDLDTVPTVTVAHVEGPVTQCVVIEGLQTGRSYHVRVQARDLDGVLSPLSEETVGTATAPFALSAALVDWGGPEAANLLSGIRVAAITEGPCSAWSETTSTDTGGRFALTNIPALEGTRIEFHDPHDRYHDMRIPASEFGFDYGSWYFLMLEKGGFTRSGDGKDGRLEIWSTYRWFQKQAAYASRDPLPTHLPYPRYTWRSPMLQVYADNHVNANGVDLRQAVLFAVGAWNFHLGHTFFSVTLDRGQADVVVTYDVAGALGRATFFPTDGLTGKVAPDSARVQIVEHASTEVFAREIFMHEFGHVLQLPHAGSTYGGELMSINPADEFPEPQEAWSARILLRLPPGTRRDWYLE